MPNFGSHLSGPVQQKSTKKSQTNRAWFSNLPIGMNDPDYVHSLVDYTKASDYTAADYTLTLVGSGTASVGTSSNTNGLLNLLAAAAGTDSSNLQSKQFSWLLDNTTIATNHAVTAIPKALWFEAGISVSSVADVDAFIGLSVSATDAFASTDYVGFRITTGSGLIACVNAASSVVSTLTTAKNGNTVSAVGGTQIKLGFKYNGSNAVEYYINRNHIGTATLNLPLATALALTYKIKSNTANARTMAIDYQYIGKIR